MYFFNQSVTTNKMTEATVKCPTPLLFSYFGKVFDAMFTSAN